MGVDALRDITRIIIEKDFLRKGIKVILALLACKRYLISLDFTCLQCFLKGSGIKFKFNRGKIREEINK